MLAALLLLANLTFIESKTLALQIALDREGFSCNTIDGVWGRKCERALAWYVASQGGATNGAAVISLTPEAAFDTYFANASDLFRIEMVTQADLDSLVRIPKDPAARAELVRMGYESIKEMFAERAHMSQRALERLNPGVDWEHIAAGTKLVIPDFTPVAAELSTWPRGKRGAPKRPIASLVRISLKNFEVRAYDQRGKVIGVCPCSIAKNKNKRPPSGELKITTALAKPNYTYTPDFTPPGAKVKRYIWPEGENCPIGVAWLGLNLPGYGIHGTPRPESIGNAESHGCFRLANWNAARLYAICPPGTKVIIEP